MALVLFVIGMGLWSRLNQCQVWHKLVCNPSRLHPGEPESSRSDAGFSGRRQALGRQIQAVQADLAATNTAQAQSGKGLTVSQATQVIAAAKQVQAVLGC